MNLRVDRGVARSGLGTLTVGRLSRKARVLALVWLGAAALTAPVSAGRALAADSGTRVLDAPRFYASPGGEVRWLDVADGLLLVSDLRQGVAGLRVTTGETVWNTSASQGRLERVTRIGERVVMVGAGVDVLDRASGRRLWKRSLGCSAQGRCDEAVVYVGAEGVMVLAGGDEEGRLGLVGLEDGKPRWRSAVRVEGLRGVRVAGGAAYLDEERAPGTWRAVELATGRAADPSEARGPSPAREEPARRLPRGAPPDGRWFSLGADGLFVSAGAPAVALVVGSGDDTVVAAGEVAAGPEAVAGASLAGDTLYLAAGRGVFGHPLVRVAAFADRVAEALEDGGADEAAALLEPLRRTGVAWAGLDALESRVAAARALGYEAAMSRGEAAGPLETLAASIGASGVSAAPGLRGVAHEVTWLVGAHLLDPRRSWREDEGAALDGLATALAGRFGELPPVGIAAETQSARALAAVRGATLTTAAALTLAGRGEAAADLLAAYSIAGLEREPGVEGLASAAAASALSAALRELRPSLRSADRAAREEAARMLASVRHAGLALVDDPALAERLAAAADGDRRGSTADAARLGDAVDKALRALTKSLGPGLGEPGCAAVCRALGEVCQQRCADDAAGCDTPFEACAAGCARTGQVAFNARFDAGGCL